MEARLCAWSLLSVQQEHDTIHKSITKYREAGALRRTHIQPYGSLGDKKTPQPLLLRRGTTEIGLEQSLGSPWVYMGKRQEYWKQRKNCGRSVLGSRNGELLEFLQEGRKG